MFHRNRLNLFALLVRELIDRSSITKLDTALDVGCNAGAYCRILSDVGFRSVVGIDVVPAELARAEATFAVPGSIEFRQQSVEDLPQNETFDFVLCAEVIEHTSDPEQTVEIIKTAVRPGGVLCVTLPNVISFPFSC